MKKLTILFSLFIIINSTIFSAPSRRIPKEFVQPNGSKVTIILQGDEHFSYYTTADNVLIRKNTEGYFCYAEVTPEGDLQATIKSANDPDKRDSAENLYIQQLNNSEAKERLFSYRQQKMSQHLITNSLSNPIQTRGISEINIPVILVEFQDVSFSENDPASKFYRRLNEPGYNEDNYYGSVYDYFYSQSNGQFAPNLDIIGPIKTENNLAHYGRNENGKRDVNVGEMVKEVCEKAEVDFSIYDNNGDGEVDMVYIIYAGSGENSTGEENEIWPHQWNLLYALGSPLSINGVNITTYACSNELYRGSIEGIGTLCHEFSHCLGLPDFYDTDGSNFGMSYWSLMDNGCYCNLGYTPCGYTGYELDFLGWRELKELDSPATVHLTAISENGQAYRIKNENEASGNEYFIVENRQNTGWDSKLFGNGLMITYVNYDESAWYNNTVNAGDLQRMTFIAADNDYQKNTVSLEGDLYPGRSGNTSFNVYSTPKAIWNDGSLLSKPITNIKEQNNIIIFDIMGGGEIISNIANHKTKNVYLKGNTIFIHTDTQEKFNIYSIDGVLKQTFITSPGENQLTISRGIYIIQSGNETFKLIVNP